MVEEPVKLKKKDQILIDEEVAKKIQAEINKEEILARRRDQQELEANIALIETWDDVQAKIDADYQLVNTFVDYRTELVEESSKKAEAKVMEGSSKREGAKLEQESSMKQKIDDDKETAKLKLLVNIILGEEGVAINVIPLAVKPPSIVD
uniref:Uncharacterized protein n=1 Tax=Tanacetum cinerariifolium TaxID=118510 RepID=A0A6L2MB50_TANCI|nr:hypothetical protein [Tanacetum cinerariifolium]